MTCSRTGPDFIIIGAMKAGTTLLYDLCAAHPQIGMSRLKETDYFIAEKNWHRGPDWYESLFPRGAVCRGEASPNYTKVAEFSGVPERIARTCPDCRLIFIARDPVRRAESHYAHAILTGATREPPLSHLIEVSQYTAQITPYLAHFPRAQLLFLEFEELVEKRAAALSKMAEFLGVEDRWPRERARANSAETLARLPRWALEMRETPVAQVLKGYVPRHLLHRMLNRLPGGARDIPVMDPAMRDQLRQALQGDAMKFREISGLLCADWSI